MTDADRIRAAADRVLALAPHYGPLEGRPMPASELTAYEAEHGVVLPDGFRSFLATFGDGALCPGVLGLRAVPLSEMRSDRVWATFIGPLADPFRWSGTEPVALPWDDDADDYELDDPMAGTLCLGSGGCDVTWILVVSGAARGTVWSFVPGLTEELQPTGLGFVDWVVRGLDRKQAELARLLR